eukprot:4517731-Amphidinium_carterae.1
MVWGCFLSFSRRCNNRGEAATYLLWLIRKVLANLPPSRAKKKSGESGQSSSKALSLVCTAKTCAASFGGRANKSWRSLKET